MRLFAPIALILLAAALVVLAAAIWSADLAVLPVAVGWGAFSVFVLIYVERFLEKRRRHSQDSTRCFFCGYDLRASPDRCPECGTAAGQRPVE